MNNINGPLKVGIGGGIGTGKTSLTEGMNLRARTTHNFDRKAKVFQKI